MLYMKEMTDQFIHCAFRLITIFDVKVILDWEGTASDGTAVKGRITIPEVSHEIVLDGLSDYVVCFSLFLGR
jgi:activator of HSP90 ATPase